MENIIIFGIIIVSVIVNIVKNYKKESEKNSKRVIIGKKPQQVNSPASNSEDSPYSFNPSETYESLEYNSQTVQNQPRANGLSTSDYIAKYNAEMEELTENTSDEPSRSSINIAFETNDELKKAVLYSTILERKF